MRTVVIIAIAALMLWFSLAVTLSLVFAKAAPERALRFWGSAEALSALASKLVLDPNPTPVGRARAREAAAAALIREPANAVAARSLGLSAALGNDQPAAAKWIHYSESVSRRDVPTQLYLIEDAVRRGDIPGALLHYQRAMDTSVGIRITLYPILAQAASEPSVANAMAPILARRPDWWPGLFEFMVGQTDPQMLAFLIGKMHLDPNSETEVPRLAAVLLRLQAAGRLDLALSLYSSVRGDADARAPLRDGSFESGRSLPPFEWTLSDDPTRMAVREVRDGAMGRVALSLYGPNSGEVGRQLTHLVPGMVRVSALAGDVSGDPVARPGIIITCVGGAQNELARIAVPPGAEVHRWVASFRVPVGPDCAFQKIAILTGTKMESADSAAWIDDVKLAPLSEMHVRASAPE